MSTLWHPKRQTYYHCSVIPRKLPKVKPVDVVREVLSALEAGREEVLADDLARQVKAGLSDEVGIYLNFDPDRTAAAAR